MSHRNISHAIAGGLSGLVSMTITYPLVTLSTNAQAKSELKDTEREKNDINMTQLLPASPISGEKTKILDKVKAVLAKLISRIRFLFKHSKKFYNGLESALIGIVAVNFAYYYVYSLVGKHYKKINGGMLNVKDNLVTGLAAGVVSRVITNPIWVANTRMTVNNKASTNGETEPTNRSTFQVIKEIFQKEGLKGLFAGIGPALILVLSPMIQFTVYEQLKNVRVKMKSRKALVTNITSLEALILGSAGKLIAILITYPYYTIRSRMHLDKNKCNSFSTLIDILKNEGLSALYGGLNAKLLQSVLSAGLIFYFKEEFMKFVVLSLNLLSGNHRHLRKTVNQFQIRKSPQV